MRYSAGCLFEILSGADSGYDCSTLHIEVRVIVGGIIWLEAGCKDVIYCILAVLIGRDLGDHEVTKVFWRRKEPQPLLTHFGCRC